MIERNRIVLLATVCVLAIFGATVYFFQTRQTARAQQAGPPTAAQAGDPTALLAGAHVVFRSTALGSGYGQIGVVALADPAGPRAILPTSCERVYATATDAVCVTATRGLVASYGVSMLNAALQPTTSAELVGLPSRARISPDGSLVSTTTFVTGHSYAESSFSTSTVVRRSTGDVVGDLESFTTMLDGAKLTAVDKNFWGVTFVDDDAFYATASSAGKTWLVRGSLSSRTMTSLRNDVECPSVSPDGTKVAFKTRQGNPAPGQWKLAVLDLRTGAESVLPETHSVDDQVEWLDNSHVLYALPRAGSDATVSDIWMMPADASAAPTVFIPQASSPAVVRI
jgi:hypothetical protein